MGKSLKGKELGKGITQRRDGLYQISITKFKKRITLYAKTEEEARRLRDNKSVSTELTLDMWHDIWLERFTSHIRDTTKNVYEVNYRRVSERIGGIKLKDLRFSDIQGCLNSMKTDRSRKSSKEVLSNILNIAVTEGIISSNPAKNAKWRIDGYVPEEKRILSYDEERLLEGVIAWYGTFHLFFRLALETGMRVGEVHGLRIEDVDLNKNLIHVRRSLSYVPGIMKLQPPKSPASVRDIPMSAAARDLLIYAISRKREIEKRHTAPEGFEDVIIVTKTNRPICEANVKHMSKLYCERVGIEYVTPHGLRHTFATRCIAKGMKPKVLQKILGHASLQLTMDLYCHVETDTMRQEMALLFDMA